MDGAREVLQPDARLHGQHELVDEVAAALGHHGRAEDAVAALRGDHLGEAVLLALHDRAVDLAPGAASTRRARRPGCRASASLRPDARHLGRGERAPGQHASCPPWPEPGHQDVAHDDARVVVGHVRELGAARDVAGGVDVRLRRLQVSVHRHALPRRGPRPPPRGRGLDVRDAAGGHQQRLRLQRVSSRRPRSAPCGRGRRRAPPVAPRAPVTHASRRPPPAARRTTSAASSSSFSRMRAARLHDRDPHAEPREGLAQLAADRAAAQDDHPVGPRRAARRRSSRWCRAGPRPGPRWAAGRRGCRWRSRRCARAGAGRRPSTSCGRDEARRAAEDVHAQATRTAPASRGARWRARRSRTRSITRLEVEVAAPRSRRPQRAACRTVWAARAEAMSALLGTQPVLRQSPPMRWRSTSATRPPEAGGARGGDEAGRAAADHDDVVRAVALGRAHLPPPASADVEGYLKFRRGTRFVEFAEEGHPRA